MRSSLTFGAFSERQIPRTSHHDARTATNGREEEREERVIGVWLEVVFIAMDFVRCLQRRCLLDCWRRIAFLLSPASTWD